MQPRLRTLREPGEERAPGDVLSVSGLSVRAGEKLLLDQAELAVRASHVVSLLGPNGSGKTTLLLALAGHRAHSGEVRVGGIPISPAERSRHLFFLPDGIAPWPAHPAIRILEGFQVLFGREGDGLETWIQRLWLDGIVSRPLGKLSKGERKRVFLALALSSPQPILLLDEPFDGLDPRRTEELADIFRQEARNGRTLLISMHDMFGAERLASEFVFLAEGKVTARGSLDDLRHQAGQPDAGVRDLYLALT